MRKFVQMLVLFMLPVLVGSCRNVVTDMPPMGKEMTGNTTSSRRTHEGRFTFYCSQEDNKPYGRSDEISEYVSFDEKKLATIPEELSASRIVFSPNGKKVAYIAIKDSRQFVMTGDNPGREFNEVDSLVFSSRGDSLTYRAREWTVGRGWEYYIVRNETIIGPFESVSNLQFSPDGRTLGYQIVSERKAFIVIGDRREGPFDGVADLTFSPDGTEVAYCVKKGKKWFVIRGGQKLGEFDCVTSLVYGGGGKRFAFVAWERDRRFIVVAGKRSRPFEQVGRPVFSPDGCRVAFSARLIGRQPRWVVVVDDTLGEEFDWVGDPIFSPDGKHVAYPANRGRTAFLVIDGKKDANVGHVGTPVFSRDGRKVAYVASEGDEGNERWFLVLDGRKGPEFEFVYNPIFSPDGEKVACEVKKEGKFFVVVGDNKSQKFDAVWTSYYRADGRRVQLASFSSDGKRFAFGAQIGRELYWKIMKLK